MFNSIFQVWSLLMYLFMKRMVMITTTISCCWWWCLQYPNPFLFSSITRSISPEDPRWVGAWWVGFVIASFLFVIASIPISMYGAELPSKSFTHLHPTHDISFANLVPASPSMLFAYLHPIHYRSFTYLEPNLFSFNFINSWIFPFSRMGRSNLVNCLHMWNSYSIEHSLRRYQHRQHSTSQSNLGLTTIASNLETRCHYRSL